MLLSGTDVLKKVKQTKKEEIIAPVVFTSTVGGLRQGEAKFKKNMTLSYTSQVWLEGLLTEVPEGILFTLSYIKELFDEDVVNGIVDVFITILTMFGNKDKELFEMTDIPLAIRDSEIIKKLNDTTEISSSISFREKLKKNCEIYAEKYAFIDEQSHMTYQELKEFSDKLNFICFIAPLAPTAFQTDSISSRSPRCPSSVSKPTLSRYCAVALGLMRSRRMNRSSPIWKNC